MKAAQGDDLSITLLGVRAHPGAVDVFMINYSLSLSLLLFSFCIFLNFRVFLDKMLMTSLLQFVHPIDMRRIGGGY